MDWEVDSQDSVTDEGRYSRVKNYAQVSDLVVFPFIGSGGKKIEWFGDSSGLGMLN